MAAVTNDPTEGSHTSYPETSSKTCTIAGIIVNIFGLEELPKDCSEVACLWLLHPRLQTQSCMKPVAALSIADWNKTRGDISTKGLIAVSFDQRNHGSREVNSMANQSWREGNETHAQDMYSIYRGTALDTSLLLDHVASYAFPGKPIKITQNLVLGISLGGHSTWHVLLHDERFDTGVVVIGCPDYLRLITDRARLSKLSSYTSSETPGKDFIGSKDFPPDLVDAVKKYDPAGFFLGQGQTMGHPSFEEERTARTALFTKLGGKRLLNQSGGADKLVPYHCGDYFLKWLKKVIGSEEGQANGKVVLDDRVYDGVGHEFTPVMLKEAVAFISDSVSRTGSLSSHPRESRI